MSENSVAQEDLSVAGRESGMEQDMLVVNEDNGDDSRSGCETVDVSDEEITASEAKENDSLQLAQALRRIAFHKPSLSLTLVTEDEDGNVTLRTEAFEDDKHVTLIMDNEGDSTAEGEIEKLPMGRVEEDTVEEDLGEALKDINVMSCLMKSRQKSSSSCTGMKRRMGVIVAANSDSDDDDDVLSRIALMPLKSDRTPVLTIPDHLDEGSLTDVECLDD